MDLSLERLVRRRAKDRCEYCRMPRILSPFTYEIDHVISRKHHGKTTAENLALACFFCNSFKGPNIAGIDPSSGRIVRLFHPRKDHWNRHFAWDGSLLIGRTQIGRATIAVLEMNRPDVLAFRRHLIDEGMFPNEFG